MVGRGVCHNGRRGHHRRHGAPVPTRAASSRPRRSVARDDRRSDRRGVCRRSRDAGRLSTPRQCEARRNMDCGDRVYGLWRLGVGQSAIRICNSGIRCGPRGTCRLKALAWRRDRRAARWMLAGVAVSAIAAVVQQSGWSLHEHFNHNDLYHVIQGVAIWLLYRSAHSTVRRVVDRKQLASAPTSGGMLSSICWRWKILVTSQKCNRLLRTRSGTTARFRTEGTCSTSSTKRAHPLR